MIQYQRAGIRLLLPNGKSYLQSWIRSNPERFSDAAQSFHGEEALCQCRPGGVPMNIRRRGALLHLANFPNKGHFHALSCGYYRPNKDVDPLRRFSSEAVYCARDKVYVSVDSSPNGSPPYTSLSPTGLLALLWDHAGLTHWSPKMQGKRTHFTATRALDDAVTHFHVNGRPLSDHLHVCAKGRDVPSDSRRPAYIVGQIARIVQGPHSNGLCFKYAQGRPFWVSGDTWHQSLAEKLGAYAAPSLHDSLYTFVIAKYYTTASGNRSLEDAGLLLVNQRWLPVSSDASISQLEQLTQTHRRFRLIPNLAAQSDGQADVAELLDAARPVYLSLRGVDI